MQTTISGDLALQEEVAEELAFDPSIDGSRIGVAARGGVVTLTGTVASYAERVAAESAAKRVRGVLGVASELEIDLAAFHRRTDAEIAAAVINGLAWSVNIPRDAVKVVVEQGWVTLEGALEWQYQKDHAEALVRNFLGVRGISNRIHVKPRIQVSEIHERLRKALERHAGISADRLTIESQSGVVTIRGPVRSWAEHAEITSAAYSVPGVTRVENLTAIAL
jgi:osmotically-inducible protein OsmY